MGKNWGWTSATGAAGGGANEFLFLMGILFRQPAFPQSVESTYRETVRRLIGFQFGSIA
jgi:hypothetical protein